MLMNGFPMSKDILLAVLAAGMDQAIIGEFAGPSFLTAPETTEGMVGNAHSFLPGSVEKFSFLSGQSSNSSGLRPEVLGQYSEAARLQGSCCAPMDFHRYQEQVEGLRAYRSTAVIPEGPYDISVRLAKELLGYQQSVTLTRDQAKRGERAVNLSEEGGPCCCGCWRGDVFEGQAKLLIAEYDWPAEGIAELW